MDVMLDLETLGTRPGCAILSIGAVAFDRHTGALGPEFYMVVNRKSCEAKGLTQDQSTLDWWSRQSAEAKKVLAEAENAPNGLGGALVQFTAYLQKFGKRDLFVWGNGADFDQPIITACYASVGYPLPWLFYNNRCYRTLRSLGNVKGEPPRQGVYHNALDDAKTQALQAVNILKQLGK
jgi:DNA polymerase III epsilon subunit-like protein